MSRDAVAGNEIGAERSAVKPAPLLDPTIADIVSGRKGTRTAIPAVSVSEIAPAAIKRIDAVVDIEREINGLRVAPAPGKVSHPGRRA